MKLRSLSGPGVVISTLIGTACDPNWAKKLDTGEITPNFSIEVELSQPVEIDELVSRTRELARLMNVPRQLQSGSPSVYFWESATEDAAKYELNLLLEHETAVARRPLGTFMLKFHHASMDDYLPFDWNRYFEFICDFIPSSFPVKNLTATRHPTFFSSQQTIQIVESRLHAQQQSSDWSYLTEDFPTVTEECAAYSALQPAKL